MTLNKKKIHVGVYKIRFGLETTIYCFRKKIALERENLHWARAN